MYEKRLAIGTALGQGAGGLDATGEPKGMSLWRNNGGRFFPSRENAVLAMKKARAIGGFPPARSGRFETYGAAQAQVLQRNRGWDQDEEGPEEAVVVAWLLVRVVTIIDLLPITIIDGSRGLHTAGVPVASSLSASDRRSVPCCL